MDPAVGAYPFSGGSHTLEARIDKEFFSAFQPDGMKLESQRRGLVLDAKPHPGDHYYGPIDFGSCRQDRATPVQHGREEHGDDRIADLGETRANTPLLADRYGRASRNFSGCSSNRRQDAD